MDFYSFLDAIEVLANKIYKGELNDNISQFLEDSNAYFESQQK